MTLQGITGNRWWRKGGGDGNRDIRHFHSIIGNQWQVMRKGGDEMPFHGITGTRWQMKGGEEFFIQSKTNIT